MKIPDINELNKLYNEADQADQELFAEQRSNVLLVTGDHFTKKGSRFWNRIRDAKDLTNEQKLRLTKNHIQKITKTYINNIVSQAPSVAVIAKNEKELQDQKAAELHNAVWQDIRERHQLRRKTYEWTKDFIEIGEVIVKIFWDPNKGRFLGYQAEVDENGQPTIDPMSGQMIPSDIPAFSGDFVFERIFAFNLLRAPEAKSMEESPYLIYRKMVDIDDLKAMVGSDKDKLKFIEESQDETYLIFDSAQGYTKASKGQALLREYYYRPCIAYPNGYFFITTMSGILFEGELPLGIFPIEYIGFDDVATSPRSRSIIKQLRPFQAEVNRTASKIAETQITLGDDKLLIQEGTKIAHGGQVPGIRAVKYTGMTPTVMPGRSGDQYLAYMQSQIQEMYVIANMPEESEPKNAQIDPFSMLFSSMRQKKAFSTYAEKMEGFLINVCMKSLKMAKAYYPDEMLIPAIGKREFINVPEFKSQDDLGYKIKLEPQTDDIETKMGKQITMTHILQYVGNQLSKDDIGKIMRMMPYGNNEQAFSDLTIDYDNATNDILALDRGQYRPARPYENHDYMIKRLTYRMKLSDFQYLPPQIQQMYEAKLTEHEKADAEQKAKIAAAKSEWIPTSGYLVVCDLYVSDPSNPVKTRRARIPYDSLSWLVKKLETQGTALTQLEQQNPQVQGDIGQFMNQSMQQGNPGASPSTESSPNNVAAQIGYMQPQQSQSQGAMNV